MKRYRFILSLVLSLLMLFVVIGCQKVEDPVVTAVFLDTENVKKEYFQGENLDLTGLKVKSVYSDGRIVEVLDYETSMKTGDSFEESGETEISVSALGRNAAFKVYVAEVQVISLTLDTENVKKEYFQSEKVDLANLKVTAIYNDGTKNEITKFETSMKTGDSFTELGNINVTVFFGGVTASFGIFVKKVEVNRITLDTENVKKEYFQSEKVDLANLKVTAIYNDGTENEITEFETSMKTGDSFDESGNVEVTVSFSGATASFGVFVKKVEIENITLNTENVKKEYYQNEKLDLKNLVVTANYNDGSKKDVTAYTTNPVNETVLSVLGKNEVTISYEGKSAVLEVEVIKNYLSLISIELPEYSDVTDLLVKDGNAFVAKEGCASYKWVLDGVFLSNTTNTYNTDLSALKYGVHELMVIVKDDKGNSYSASATFVIEL